ncbi:hypothetical protein DSL92_00640 [Billgrantia gudaonensis]|uniref:Uncharacterized protein n=1 Tax=Billgrantia gudaonensis TaxID=376427 RepID=A0A3S0NEN2_9GAMM|nr:hypothetical protein DSL92_00640 [Halomonas gudaonensis]
MDAETTLDWPPSSNGEGSAWLLNCPRSMTAATTGRDEIGLADDAQLDHFPHELRPHQKRSKGVSATPSTDAWDSIMKNAVAVLLDHAPGTRLLAHNLRRCSWQGDSREIDLTHNAAPADDPRKWRSSSTWACRQAGNRRRPSAGSAPSSTRQ